MADATRTALLHYGLAVVWATLAVVVRLLLDPLLHQRVPFITLFAAVLLAAWYSGRGPALVTLFLGALAVPYFILSPRFTFGIKEPEYVAGLVLYTAVGGGSIVLFERLRQAQAAAAAQREWLRVTLASIGDAVITTDTDGRVSYLNAVAEELTGWRTTEANGRPLDEVFVIVNEETRRSVENPALRALREGRIVGLANHTLLIARNGTERPLDDAGSPIRDERGQVLGAVLVFRDASEQRRHERELHERDERLRFALAATGMVAWDLDLETNHTVRSHTAAEMMGLQSGPDEEFYALIHPDDRARVQHAVEQARQGEAAYDVAFRLLLADGRMRWIIDRARRRTDPTNGRAHLTGVMIDVTEQHRAEEQVTEAIRRRSEQLQRLARAATEVNVAHDARSILDLVTHEARRLIDAHQAAAIVTGNPDGTQAIAAVSLSERYAAWRRYDVPLHGFGLPAEVCRGNRPMRLTQTEVEAHPAWRGFGREASRHPPLRGWLAAPLVSRDGRNIGLIQLSDKTEGEFTADDEAVLVQLAQMTSIALENARLYQDLRDADERKDEFLATLAHELRNPLAPLRNGLNLMRLAGERGGATVEQARAMMERQLTQLVRLVDDLLDVSRITRGKLELRQERVELASVIHSAVETSWPLLERMGHRFTLTLPQRPVHVEADLTRLAQVFVNLLNNAAKYTPPGGQINLAAECEANEVVVRVKDTGIGIPADMLRRIFEMFTQVDRSLERATGGLGIGLTLVEQLVKMHSGRVEAHSAGPGQGSEMVVRLPRLPDEAVVEATAPPSSAPPAAGRRILLVDDNRDAADSMAMLLRLLGHEVYTVYDGAAAVAAAERLRPAAVVLDIGMPGMSGYETARRIRALPGGRQIVLVALTGWGQETDQRRSQEAGFDHHLTKPADPAVLQAILATLERR